MVLMAKTKTTKIITEEQIRRRLIMLAIVIAIVIYLLVLSFNSILSSLDAVQVTSADSMTQTRAGTAVQEVMRHINSDQRIVRLLAIFYDTITQLRPGDEMIIDSIRAFQISLDRLGFPSDFLTILWYGPDGEGLRADLENGTVRQIWLSDDTSVIQETIDRAFAGEAAVSTFYFDPALQRRVIIYAQPLYLEGRITGVIAGTHGVDEIQDILTATAEAEPFYSYFLVDDTGTFIAAASDGNYPEIIYYTQGTEMIAMPLFPPETRTQIQRTQRGFITIRQENSEYHGYIQPLRIGAAEMRIICVNTNVDTASVTNQQIASTKFIFSVFCVFVALSIILGVVLTYGYGNRLIRFLYFDTLTGADNTNRFRRKLATRRNRAIDSGDYVCVATLNVRQFRSINEIFGVDNGNQLLFIIKQALSEHLQKDEFFCRESYDTFHVCLHDHDHAEITMRLKAIMDEVVQKYLEIHDYHLKMYAGVVVIEPDQVLEITVNEMFLRLSLALSKAKANASDSFCFYEDTLYAQEETENYIETHMEQALADGSFKVYLQPKMDLASGTIGAAEALVRWDANGERMIYPDQFIPFFNKNGFCVKLDMYMLEQVCKLMREWIDSGIEPIPISVNQSRLLFFEAKYVDNVTAIAAKYSIPPGLITLEVLEEMYLEKTDVVNTKIAELRKRGFLISMDDFGSGYSSFSAIGELSVDELKLDRKFLMTASGAESWRMKIVLDQVVKMARRLHLSVVAEGVETKEDEMLIRALGCDYGQGYYYCKPIPAAEFNERYMHNLQSQTLDDDDEEPFSPELI